MGDINIYIDFLPINAIEWSISPALIKSATFLRFY